MTDLNTIALKLYDRRVPVETWLQVFTKNELIELWSNCKNDLDIAYDDEVYEALRREGYFVFPKCYRCEADLTDADNETENGKSICIKCYKKLLRRYPQGWNYYAGDICKHGHYTGGCGVDWICGQCEDGV